MTWLCANLSKVDSSAAFPARPVKQWRGKENTGWGYSGAGDRIAAGPQRKQAVIDNMGNVIGFSLHFFILEERERECPALSSSSLLLQWRKQWQPSCLTAAWLPLHRLLMRVSGGRLGTFSSVTGVRSSVRFTFKSRTLQLELRRGPGEGPSFGSHIDLLIWLPYFKGALTLNNPSAKLFLGPGTSGRGGFGTAHMNEHGTERQRATSMCDCFWRVSLKFMQRTAYKIWTINNWTTQGQDFKKWRLNIFKRGSLSVKKAAQWRREHAQAGWTGTCRPVRERERVRAQYGSAGPNVSVFL